MSIISSTFPMNCLMKSGRYCSLNQCIKEPQNASSVRHCLAQGSFRTASKNVSDSCHTCFFSGIIDSLFLSRKTVYGARKEGGPVVALGIIGDPEHPDRSVQKASRYPLFQRRKKQCGGPLRLRRSNQRRIFRADGGGDPPP